MTASTESQIKAFDKALRLGRDEELLELLNGKHGKAIAKTKDSLGQYPLHRIVTHDAFFFSKAYKLISKLLSLFPAAIDTCDKGGRYALHLACATKVKDSGCNPDAVLCLLKARPEHAFKQEASTKMLPLHYACKTQPDKVIKALVEVYPDALRIMDAAGNLPAHFAAGNKGYYNLEYLHTKYPEAFMHKNKNGEMPIDCCAKDDDRFLHLAKLCPKSLFHINERNIHSSVLLNPVLDFLVKRNLARCRVNMLRKVFHEVFQCLLAEKAHEGSCKDEEIKNKLKRERDEALREKEKLEEENKRLETETTNLKKRNKQTQDDSAELLKVVEKERDGALREKEKLEEEGAKLTHRLKNVEKERDGALHEKDKLEEENKRLKSETRNLGKRKKQTQDDRATLSHKLAVIEKERYEALCKKEKLEEEGVKLSHRLKNVERERDEALRKTENLEERWKSLSIDNSNLKERLKKEEAGAKSADEKLTTVETERARLTQELISLQTQNGLLVQDFIKEGQILYAALLPFIEPTCQDDSNTLPMEALKALASLLNRRQELVKSHGSGKPSTEISSQQLLLEGFLSNPNLSRSSLTSLIKCTYRELQEMDVKLPSNGCTTTTGNQNPQSTVTVDESPENQRAKRARVSMD